MRERKKWGAFDPGGSIGTWLILLPFVPPLSQSKISLAMSPPVTSTQGVLSTSLLLCLCLLTAPLSAIAVALATLRTTLKGREAEENRSLIGDQRRRRTALVNGGRMQKSLFVARALAKRGFRVVLVEERG